MLFWIDKLVTKLKLLIAIPIRHFRSFRKLGIKLIFSIELLDNIELEELNDKLRYSICACTRDTSGQKVIVYAVYVAMKLIQMSYCSTFS